MVKKISENQKAGYIGEDEFRLWASKIGWHPTKTAPDHGLDFFCQLEGEKVSEKSYTMPGKIVAVSVRSTEKDKDVVRITRDDAQLFLTTNTPMVFAVVRRGSVEESGEISIQFPDEKFIRELDNFLQSSAEHYLLRFSDAISKLDTIQQYAVNLFKEAPGDRIARIRANIRLQPLMPDSHVEILHTDQGIHGLVRTNQITTPCLIEKRPDVKSVLSDIGFPFKEILPIENSDFQNTERDLIIGQLRDELSKWNVHEAIVLSEQIESTELDVERDLDLTLAEIIILLARTHIFFGEEKGTQQQQHIERARKLISKTVPLLSISKELLEEIIALNASIENIENGPDSAIAMLEGRVDSFAIRSRTAILIQQQKYTEALCVVEGREPHERWCDVAVTAYAMNDRIEEAQTLVRWAAGLSDRSRYWQCLVRLAEALLARATAGHKTGIPIQLHDLTPGELGKLKVATETVQPILQLVRAAGKPSSGLDMAALQVDWQANHLLQLRKAAGESLRLMLPWTPVPLDVARGVLNGYLEAPSDLPDRLRRDHPGDFTAGMLAALVESIGQKHFIEAFARAKGLLTIVDNDEKKEELSSLFSQIWQYLEDPEVTECQTLVRTLTAHNPQLYAIFEGAVALRQGNSDQAMDILDAYKSEDDPYWLQLRANALLQKRQPAEAVGLLFQAAKMTCDAGLLRQTGDLAIQAERNDLATWCYERLAELGPQDSAIHGNLAYIYMSVLHDLEKAAVQFRTLHAAEPSNPTHTQNLAICLAQLYRPEESLSFYNELCRWENPPLAAVLGRARLHHSLGRPDRALESLEPFQERFGGETDFLTTYWMILQAAGKEEKGQAVLRELIRLQEEGKIDPEVMQRLQTDEMQEMILQTSRQIRDRDEHLHSQMVQGRMPWIWAELTSGNAIYLGWRIRTQEMDWIGDDPANRARFGIYSTNGFHPRESEHGRRELLPLECPPAGTSIVADISALVTLHRLNLLGAAAEYFGEILVPVGYLPAVLEESAKMMLPQLSQRQIAEQIVKHITAGRILVIKEGDRSSETIPIVDEYGESPDQKYRLRDLIDPIYRVGLINDEEYAKVLKVCSKPSSVDGKHPGLEQFQDVCMELMTLETVARLGMLDTVAQFYRVHLTSTARQEIVQRLEAFARQEETRQWHMDMWSLLRNHPRFRFVPHTVPEKMRRADWEARDYLPFLACFISHETKMPLLADDRVCQAFTLNESAGAVPAAFGSDVVVTALMISGKLEPRKAADALLQLMAWRYRFLIPRPEMLEILAARHRGNPPGHLLQVVAEYVQDCMRDEGLFRGSENTMLQESMAIRLHMTWISTIAEFLVLVWTDENFSAECAMRLTDWSCRELLPSAPKVMNTCQKVQAGEVVLRMLLSRTLLLTHSHYKNPRMAEALFAVKKAMHLSNETYLRIVLEILKDAAGSVPSAPEAESEEIRKAFHNLQLQMWNCAFRSFQRIDPRTLTALLDLDLFKESIDPIGGDIDMEILRDPHHEQRIPLSPGPLLLYRNQEKEPKRIILDVSLLLFSSISAVRNTAFMYLDRQISDGLLRITPKTRDVLQKMRTPISSDASHEWRPAAIALSDAMNDDLLVALQAVRQSLTCDTIIQDSLNTYVPRILHPAVSSFDSLSFEVANPESEHSQLTDIVSSVVSGAGTLQEACDGYYARLGYLPLAPSFAMVEVVSKWIAEHPSVEVWPEIWQWAQRASGPIPRYHACSVFVLRPEWIPEGKLAELWREILDVVNGSGERSDDGLDQEPWALRRDLSRHFIRHLEAHLPESEGTKIACFSWWLSEQVASLFPEDPESVRFYRKNWIVPASEQSLGVWLVARSPIGCSFFRYVTTTISSPWAMALLAIMGRKMEPLKPQEQDEGIKSQFHEALIRCLIDALPIIVEPPTDPTYALECDLGETALQWAAFQAESQRTALEQIITTSRTLNSVEQLCATLRQLADKSLPDQIAIAFILRMKAYTNKALEGSMGEILSDNDWRKQVFGSTEENVLGILMGALTILQVRTQEKWSLLLPHFLAEICEQAEDEDRCHQLFLFLLYSSLASETVSAVQRLLKGDRKASFKKYSEEFIKYIEAKWPHFPPWVQGRLRGLMACLLVT